MGPTRGDAALGPQGPLEQRGPAPRADRRTPRPRRDRPTHGALRGVPKHLGVDPEGHGGHRAARLRLQRRLLRGPPATRSHRAPGRVRPRPGPPRGGIRRHLDHAGPPALRPGPGRSLPVLPRQPLRPALHRPGRPRSPGLGRAAPQAGPAISVQPPEPPHALHGLPQLRVGHHRQRRSRPGSPLADPRRLRARALRSRRGP